MKYILLVVIVLAGCQFEPPMDYVAEMEWTYNLIEYETETTETLGYQTPYTTMKRRTGDCEDFALLFLYKVWFTYGVKGELIVIQRKDDSLRRHAITRIDGVYYDPTWNMSRNDIYPTHLFTWAKDYDEIMRLALIW